jgi:alpha-tubulin suppressor-like RCC1 family protein
MLKQKCRRFSGKIQMVKECALSLAVALLLVAGPGMSYATAPRFASSGSHNLEVKQDGTVWAWGNNNYGQLGNGKSGGSSDKPVQVIGLTGVKAVSASSSHSIALKNDGTVWAWGYNGSGELGNGTTNNSATPVQVKELTGVMAIATGNGHTVALKSDGTVWAWGSNRSDQLGKENHSTFTSPIQVGGLSGIVAIAAGSYHTIALKRDGTVWAWGYNLSGQLGDHTDALSATPVQVAELKGVMAIAAGSNHSVALKGDGTVWAWGNNRAGQLGNNSSTVSSAPIQVSELRGVTAISAAGDKTVALLRDCTVWAWGSDITGISASSAVAENHSMPVLLSGLGGGSAFSTAALLKDRISGACSDSGTGQLAMGTFANPTSSPLQEKSIGNTIALLSAFYTDLH